MNKDRYYDQRFQFLRHLTQRVAPLMDVSRIIEQVRDELRHIIPSAMEVCILLLDADADQYIDSLQCALYDTPVSCQSCKRERAAVQKAIQKKETVVVNGNDSVLRIDGSTIAIGAECALPVFVEGRVIAVISVVILPLARFIQRDFFLLEDCADILGTFILNGRRQWKMTQEKIRISKALSQLSPFVPGSVRRMAQENPEMLNQKKQRRQVTVLFLDLEGYTQLSQSRPEAEVNAAIETLFSSFVDPIHRYQGEINETAGDGLMILFAEGSAGENAANAAKAAFEVMDKSRVVGASLPRALRPMEVNIGINSGTALVGMSRFSGALDTRMTFTATGSVTNMAARLSDLARGGDILIGPQTRKLIKDLWPTHPRGEVSLKGIQEPQSIYSLTRKFRR